MSNSSTDVIVLGLGAMGSAAAQHLAERGHSVRGFDRYAPPHSYGSSHGRTRIFRQAYFEDDRYVPLLLRAFELWKKLEHDTGQHLLHLTGALVIGPLGGQLVRRSAQSAGLFNLPHRILGSAELKRLYPVLAVQPDTHALIEENAGYLCPEACVEQQLRQAVRAGAQLHTEEPALDWLAGRDGTSVTVRTAKGTYSADRLVITAGPWAPQLLAELGLPLSVTRQVLYWFEPKGSLDPFRQGRLPVYMFEEEGSRPLVYGFPLTGPDLEGVKVGLHGSEDIGTPESLGRNIRPSDEVLIRERLASTIPSLAGRLLHAETCLYTMTPDEHFLLGAHPHHPAVTIAAGFSGHGFKFAPVIGEIIAELVAGGSAQLPTDLFSFRRFLPATPALG